MKIKIFMNTAGNNQEREILRCMHDGIHSEIIPGDPKVRKEWNRINKELGRKAGVWYDYSEKHSSCDLAVMFGSWKPDRSNLHHTVRASIAHSDENFMCIETPLLNRRTTGKHFYYRVGINGFMNRDAFFVDDINYPKDRLESLGIDYKGWRLNAGNKIVIALQLPGDASLRNNDIAEWCADTVETLRLHTDRPIEIRTHPAMSSKGWTNYEEIFRNFLFNGHKGISFVDGKKVPCDAQILDAYCVVAYTSGLSIDAIVNGIPVLACDEGNFAWNVGERKLENIENLNLAAEDEVQQWLQNLAYCQWSPEEMESGRCYRHLRPCIEKLLKEK